jgi:glutamyl-tRNA reductase
VRGDKLHLVLVSLSANHKVTDFVTLERLSTVASATVRSLHEAHEHIRGAVVVATCNRVETYLELSESEAAPLAAINAVITTLAEASGLEEGQLRDSIDYAHGEAVVTHVFSVAAGLESVVLGEDEIAGQVRRALTQAREQGTASPELERLFQRATETSREVKQVAPIAAAGRSIVRRALELVGESGLSWATARVLLVGTGQYAATTLAALRELGVTEVRVYSVSHRGEAFAASHDLELVARPEYPREAALADLIITCTTATHYVLDAHTLATGRTLAGSAAPQRQSIVDLGLPRNINPGVAEVSGVELLDLETIRTHAPVDDLATVAAARQVVLAASERFAAASRALDATPSVVALRSHVHDLLETELARARAKDGYTPAVEAALRHFAGVLLHQPMERSRELATSGEADKWVAGVTAVFGLEADAS